MSDSQAKGRLVRDLGDFTTGELDDLLLDWSLWGREDQLPPVAGRGAASWRTWLILGGRGAGKTRAGAEWVRARALGLDGRPPAGRIALVGETIADVRRVMVEGPSGVLAVHGAVAKPRFESSKGEIVWNNGSLAQLFSAETADSLRGPQFDCAWCDEIAKWREPQGVWDMLQFALRLGQHPQVVVTTTPRPVPIVKALMSDAATVVTRASTMANARNLAPGFIDEMRRRYAGTVLGRQELDGEIVEDLAGALWKREWIERGRVSVVPEMHRIVVAVDPPVTATVNSDTCGIIVAGLGSDGRAYVMADRSVKGRLPNAWARAVVETYHEVQADRVVAEVNQGGDLVVSVLRQIDEAVPVTKVYATRGKWVRAEPVAALYAEGRVAHAGVFEMLEEQMAAFGAGGFVSGRSPDRVDALVWALTDLMLGSNARPGIRAL